MAFGGKAWGWVGSVGLALGLLTGCGGGYSGDYPAPAELEQEAQLDQYQYEMEQQYDELAQDAWKDDLVATCIDDQLASGYNGYQAESYCLDNYDLYVPESGWDEGFEDYGYDEGYDYDYGGW